jgi:hypothetical protein
MIDFSKHILRRIFLMISDTRRAWNIIAAENKPVSELRKTYVFPLILFCVLVTFLFKMLYTNENAFQIGFLGAFIEGIALFGGYFLSIKVAMWYFKKQNYSANAISCETIIAYSYSTIYVINVAVSVFPSLFFLKILYVHCAFLVWEGLRTMCGMEEDERGNTVILLTASIIFLPILINKMIYLMLPNV